MRLIAKGLRFMLLTALLMALLPTGGALADDREAAALATQEWTEQIAKVAANPDAFIAGLVSKWEPVATALGYPVKAWAQEFEAALKRATPEDLLRIDAATSYNAVRAILQGRFNLPVAVPGEIVIQDLGDIDQDLTFTPVSPCRIWDTRNVGGIFPHNTSINYVVYGDAATIEAQGGNPAGCPAPKGEPVAVAINVTATQGSAGHLRVYPYGTPFPNSSFLNFFGGNIANAGIIPTCYLCAYDITVWNQGDTHHLADVMGYFYPAEIGNAVEIRQGGYDNCCGDGSGQDLIDDTPPAFIGPYSGNTVLTVAENDEVLIQFTALVFADASGQVCGTARPAYRNTANDAVTQVTGYTNETDFGFPSTGSQDMRSIQGSARVGMPAGTFEFGFYAIKGATDCPAAQNFWITSKKITVTKIRRP